MLNNTVLAAQGLTKEVCPEKGAYGMLLIANQYFVMPLSSDLPMLTYLILRRRSLSPRAARWRTPEMWAGILMLVFALYIKITFLPQPAKIITGFVVGLLLFAFDRLRQRNTRQEGPAQQTDGAVTQESARSAAP